MTLDTLEIVELIRNAFGWCGIINLVILLFWFLMLVFVNEFVYKIHSRMFRINKKRFDAIHYQGMMYFKVFVIMFNVVPYLALRIVG